MTYIENRETFRKGGRDENGRFAPDLYLSPRGNWVRASGSSRKQRQETLKAMIDLVNGPATPERVLVSEMLAMEIEGDYAQGQKEKRARERAEARRRKA